jgi:glycosyltransferase involved in cell wall biosynthesis
MQNLATASKPLLSIITIVFNGGKTLQKTIEHVINQDYKNYEYIIIDGGSSDNSVDIIKRYGKYLSFWISEKDNGIYDALNKGISKTKGDIIGIINSDDWYEPGAFKHIADHYSANPGADIYYGLLRFWTAGNNVMAVQGYTDEYLTYGMISHPTCFVKKTVYDTYGTFNTKYRIAADYDFMLRVKQKGCLFHFIEHVLANFAEGGVSTTHLFKIGREILDIKADHQVLTKKQYKLQRAMLWFKEKLSAFTH